VPSWSTPSESQGAMTHRSASLPMQRTSSKRNVNSRIAGQTRSHCSRLSADRPAIREFTFRLDDVRCIGNDALLCVIVPWDSLGVDRDGTTFSRPGRATLLLVRRERWVAVHSHFSLAPEPGKRRAAASATKEEATGC